MIFIIHCDLGPNSGFGLICNPHDGHESLPLANRDFVCGITGLPNYLEKWTPELKNDGCRLEEYLGNFDPIYLSRVLCYDWRIELKQLRLVPILYMFR